MCSDTKRQDSLETPPNELTCLQIAFHRIIEQVIHLQGVAQGQGKRISAVSSRVRVLTERQKDLDLEIKHQKKLSREQGLAIGMLATATLIALKPIDPLNKAEAHIRMAVVKEVEKISNYYDGRET